MKTLQDSGLTMNLLNNTFQALDIAITMTKNFS